MHMHNPQLISKRRELFTVDLGIYSGLFVTQTFSFENRLEHFLFKKKKRKEEEAHTHIYIYMIHTYTHKTMHKISMISNTLFLFSLFSFLLFPLIVLFSCIYTLNTNAQKKILYFTLLLVYALVLLLVYNFFFEKKKLC